MKEIKEVTLNEDWPFVVIRISKRRYVVARVVYYGERVSNHRGLGFYSLQVVGDKGERFSSEGEATDSAANHTIKHLIDKLGETPARDAVGLRTRAKKLNTALTHFGNRISSKLVDEADRIMDDCQQMAEIAETFEVKQ